MDKNQSTVGLCVVCQEEYDFSVEEVMRIGDSDYYHTDCFVCHACFQPFGEEQYYTDESDPPKLYCKRDYWRLIGPRCLGCGDDIYDEFIIGFDSKWHFGCFRCSHCSESLEKRESAKKTNIPLCQKCYVLLGTNARPAIRCQWRGALKAHRTKKCGKDLGKFLIYTNVMEGYNNAKICPEHLTCYECTIRLDEFGREKYSEWYCRICYDKLGAKSTCANCRQIILERPLEALGKSYHPNHFVCTDCELPLAGGAYYEHSQLPFCLEHYKERALARCYVCSHVPQGTEKYTMSNKVWCTKHWTCSLCFIPLSEYLPFDMRPLCPQCFEHLPNETVRLVRSLAESEKAFEKKLKKRQKV